MNTPAAFHDRARLLQSIHVTRDIDPKGLVDDSWSRVLWKNMPQNFILHNNNTRPRFLIWLTKFIPKTKAILSVTVVEKKNTCCLSVQFNSIQFICHSFWWLIDNWRWEWPGQAPFTPEFPVFKSKSPSGEEWTFTPPPSSLNVALNAGRLSIPFFQRRTNNCGGVGGGGGGVGAELLMYHWNL